MHMYITMTIIEGMSREGDEEEGEKGCEWWDREKCENTSCIWMKVVQGNPLTAVEKWKGEGRWRKENKGN
jgi:hypothetical protein